MRETGYPVEYYLVLFNPLWYSLVPFEGEERKHFNIPVPLHGRPVKGLPPFTVLRVPVTSASPALWPLNVVHNLL